MDWINEIEKNIELSLPEDDLQAAMITDRREWFRRRLGMFTGSMIPKLMTSGRSKDQIFGQTALTEIYRVAAERDLTDHGIELYIDQQIDRDFKQTRWGNEYESEARELVCASAVRGRVHPTIPTLSASADGIFGGGEIVPEIGEIHPGTILEIKCPYTIEKHKANGRIKDIKQNEYYDQMQTEIACYDAPGCVFVSYDPRSKTPLFAHYVPRDNDRIAEIEKRVLEAEKIINEIGL